MSSENPIPNQEPSPFRAVRLHIHLAAEHVVDAERRRVVVKFGHKLTPEDLGRYANLLRSNPKFDPSFSEIVDLRHVEEMDFQAEDFYKLADKIDPFSYQAKRAFVVSTAVQHHAARMHRILRAQRNIEIFHSFEDAERWLET
jgi:carbonic anhydrase